MLIGSTLLSLLAFTSTLAVAAEQSTPTGTPTTVKFTSHDRTDSIDVTARKSLFIHNLVGSCIPDKRLYCLVSPSTPDPTIDTQFFDKVRIFNSKPKSKTAAKRIDKFISTNHLTQTNKVYVDDNNLPKPLYLSEVQTWAFEAAAKGDLATLRTLLDNYHILHIKDKHGKDLLAYAIDNRQYDVADFLIMRGIDKKPKRRK
jgi:hypothetical protein